MGLGGQDIFVQIAHAYAMLCVDANAVVQLRELANIPKELRGVVVGSILPADIFTDDGTKITVLYPVNIMAIAFVPAILAIRTVLAIWEVANAVCDEQVQLWKISSDRKMISSKRTQRTRKKSLTYQFHAICRLVSEGVFKMMSR
ncbi:MAG: hypothetical protein EZS28_020950 [Streblomastix strix]|uniref:Uncharacterized protein n=1 Tax=Streblomastix strix TaxID=222440 RepID=A0A5J4VLR5_9EUKA|nr:MAG: hypothetical protein EZS28_020950 [Streblomastix strix]